MLTILGLSSLVLTNYENFINCPDLKFKLIASWKNYNYYTYNI